MEHFLRDEHVDPADEPKVRLHDVQEDFHKAFQRERSYSDASWHLTLRMSVLRLKVFLAGKS